MVSTVTHVHICMHTLSVCVGLDFSSDDDDDEAEETAAARLIELESKQASLILGLLSIFALQSTCNIYIYQ